jgi:pyrroloquinoline quinone biosynthesis protein E
MLPGLAFPNVRELSLREIWFDSEGFNRYRGTGWMQEPCASCEQREQDLGGCRCQAFLLAQDPAATDPGCSKSPQHQRVADAVARAGEPVAHPLVFRAPEHSRRLTSGTTVTGKRR